MEYLGILRQSTFATRQTYLESLHSISGTDISGNIRTTGTIRKLKIIGCEYAMVYTDDGVYCIEFEKMGDLFYLAGFYGSDNIEEEVDDGIQ